jgi:hypothetical protein
VPILTYANEIWTRNRSDRRKIESTEMRFLHPVAGYTLSTPKTKYRHTFGVKDIQFNRENRKAKENWYGYVLALPDFLTSSGSGTRSTQPREDN